MNPEDKYRIHTQHNAPQYRHTVKIDDSDSVVDNVFAKK